MSSSSTSSITDYLPLILDTFPILSSVPIYVIACIATIGIGFIADKKGNRALINLGCSAVGVVGYIVLIASRNAGVSYAFIYL